MYRLAVGDERDLEIRVLRHNDDTATRHQAGSTGRRAVPPPRVVDNHQESDGRIGGIRDREARRKVLQLAFERIAQFHFGLRMVGARREADTHTTPLPNAEHMRERANAAAITDLPVPLMPCKTTKQLLRSMRCWGCNRMIRRESSAITSGRG